MLITNAHNQVSAQLGAKSASSAGVKATSVETAPPVDVFKKSVTGAAYAAGGALGGLALGAVGGEVMSRLTQNEIFSTLGGGVGALGGAATSLALSLSHEPVSLARTLGSWAGASVGATGGMYAMSGVGSFLSSHGAAAFFGTQGALLGAVGLGLAGTGIAFTGAEGKAATMTKSAAKMGAGALTGLAVGGGVQMFLSQVPTLAPIAASAPFVAAAALGLVGLQSEINKDWASGYSNYEPSSPVFDTVAHSGFAAAMGYGVGSFIGGTAALLGGSPAYAAVGPVLGAAVMAAEKYGELKKDNLARNLAEAGGVAGVSALLGDLVGHGLTALTGQPVFQMVGAGAGAITGAAAILDSQKRINKFVAPVTAGLTAGTATGILFGAGLTALTGHPAYQVAGSVIGAAAGLFAGLAGGAHRGETASLATA